MSTSQGHPKMGVVRGALLEEQDEEASEGNVTPKAPPAQMPRLIAPKPIHAAPRFLPLSQIDSSRMEKSQPIIAAILAHQEKQAEVASPTQVSAMQRSTPSLRALTDKEAILPVKGDDEDASEAVEKLERMTRALQNKRRLLRGTGVEGLAIAATAGGKQRARKVKGALKEKEKESEELEALPSIPDYGEVKVGISSLPGYHILAAKREKYKQGRSNTVFNLVADDNANERNSFESGAEEENGSILRRLSKRTPTFRSKGKTATPAPKVDKSLTHTQELVRAQTDASLDLPSKEEISRPLAANPDLTSVKEESRMEDGAETPKQNGFSPEVKGDAYKKSRSELRPLLMIQSPSEHGVQMHPVPQHRSSGLQMTPMSDFNSSFISSSASDTEGIDDDPAQAAAAQNAQRNILQSSSLYTGQKGAAESFQLSPSSSSSGESDGSGSASDSEASSMAPTQQEEFFLSLQHGNELNTRQKRKLIKRMRRSKKVTPEGEAKERLAKDMRRNHARKGSLSSKVQVGLHYASSQSRNRRAMEKYSPHPSRPSSTAPWNQPSSYAKTDSANNLADLLNSSKKLSMAASGPPSALQSMGNLGDTLHSSTPNLDLVMTGRDATIDGSRRSSMSDSQRVLRSVADIDEADFCMSPVVADGFPERDEQWAEMSKSIPMRKPTANSISSSNTGQASSFRKRYFSLRRRKQDTSDVVEESASDDEVLAREDGEKELDKVLGKLAAEQAPEECKEQYEYDVLYENQRGIMFFGMPKFSARTLFQWDPSPWTNAYNGSSAYNIVNAQLPNPSWEWVHPEWLIDMSGDVDESGWQYSHNFGKFGLNLFARPTQVVPRANAQGNTIMNERMAKKVEERKVKEETREDHGFEALKRTARTRNAKWTGIPDQNKYVRRRRWIRLRRKKAVHSKSTPHHTPGRNTPVGVGRASGDWSHMIREEEPGQKRHVIGEKEGEEEAGGITNDDTLTSSSSSSSDDGTLSSLESDEADEFASEGAASSSFLPRPTPGNLSSDPDLVGRKADRDRERQRKHEKEFNGTIRELKTLLPAILDPKSHHRPMDRQRYEHEIWMSEIDARNPFLSWNLVKKRLEDDDLAFATTALRARERRYAQRIQDRKGRAEFRRGTSHDYTRGDQSFALTKDAVVEINYRRAMRVMRACRVDRQKLLLWKIWLGIEPVASLNELSQDEDLASSGLFVSLTSASISTPKGEKKDASLRHARNKWRRAVSHADIMDVWDLLERRLDRLLLTFEYQGSRSALLMILLSIHASSHPNHRFKSTHWNMDIDGQTKIEPNAPSTLSPYFGSRDNWKEDGAIPDRIRSTTPSTPAGEEWRAVKLPRLEFWSDLEKCAKALLQDGNSSSSRQGTPILKAIGGDASPSQLLGGGPPFTGASSSTSPPMHSLSNGVFLNRSSPVPSVGRSNTPGATIGSLSNGPSARRFSHHNHSSINSFPSSFLMTSSNGRYPS